MPERVLDLFAEFACLTSGMTPPSGRGLLGALIYHGLPAIDTAEKTGMRDLAMRGGPYTTHEQTKLLDYCQIDVDGLSRLLPAMLPCIDFPRALLRGRYTVAAARMEWLGVSIDRKALDRLRVNWDRVKSRLVAEVNEGYGVFEPVGRAINGTTWSRATLPVIVKEFGADIIDHDGSGKDIRSMRFSAAKWSEYLTREGIPWPQLDSGALALDDDTFKEMAKLYPEQVGPIRELRHALSQMRLNELAVGPDGRNRLILSAFGSKTGRNQPSNSKFIFGPSCWLRSLIRPGPGKALAYCDWSAQELGIAAALSGDKRMQEAYQSGDPYLWFGKSARLVPVDATKKTHGAERNRFKVVMLGVLYGLSADGLARKLGLTPAHGRELMRLHREQFRQFWKWSDMVQDEAMLTGQLRTAFGWTVRVGPDTKPTSLRNFPMQANGAEMMRLAACLATEGGIGVCCPVHDAFLIEAPTDLIETETGRMQLAMRKASELVLPGFPLRTDANIIRHPDRYSDDRGRTMWETVTWLLDAIDPPG